MNPQKVSDAGLPPVGGRGTSGAVASTSLSPSRGERGSVFFSTKPKILVCDLSLLTGQEKECNIVVHLLNYVKYLTFIYSYLSLLQVCMKKHCLVSCLLLLEASQSNIHTRLKLVFKESVLLSRCCICLYV